MKKIYILLPVIVINLSLIQCGNTEEKKTTENTKQSQEEAENKINPSSTITVEFHTAGMTCTGCENTIKTKVKKIEGVIEVTADHKKGIVRARYDPNKTNPEVIKEAITSSGYRVENYH